MSNANIIKPKTTEEVSSIVKQAMRDGTPITPMGCDSWIYSGVVPDGGIVIDFDNMDRLIDVDGENQRVTVDAGVRWDKLYDTVLKSGFLLGTCPSNASSSTVGGWINTGGYGIGSYKYGGIEEQIRSLEVVLSNGRVINTGFDDVASNSSGYSLTELMVGAEGTLGLITKSTLKIYPKEDLRNLSYSFIDIDSLAEAVYVLARSKVTPFNISFSDKNHSEFLRNAGKNAPEGPILNITLKGSKEMMNYEEGVIDQLMGKGKKEDASVANQIWDERYYDVSIKKLGSTIILPEAMVPVSHMNDMINCVYDIASSMGLKSSVNGLIIDRSTVLLMPYSLPGGEGLKSQVTAMALGKKVDELCTNYGGCSVMGVVHDFSTRRDKGEDVTSLKDVKMAFDPYNILNPNRSPKF
ncbi:MAG: FAD-binding oxidoreductase [Halobacteriota archaeon]|nr:FAD-binding oxidoreductase [Halobacteriota archaeon]